MAKSKKSAKTKTKARSVTTVKAVETAEPEPILTEVPAPQSRLHTWNIWLAVLHGVQGLALLVLAATHTIPVTVSYLAKDPIASQIADHPVWGSAVKHLFDVNLALLVAVFFFIAALAHLAAATVWRHTFEADVARGSNKLRWIEYALSGSVMLVVVGLISGVYDVASLLMLFAFGIIASLLMLSAETRSKSSALYWLAAATGLVPWLVVVLYLCVAHTSGQVPGYVYVADVTTFIFFAGLAVVAYLQHKRQGSWANHTYSERVFMIVSLIAKAALAWQVFAGALRP